MLIQKCCWLASMLCLWSHTLGLLKIAPTQFFMWSERTRTRTRPRTRKRRQLRCLRFKLKLPRNSLLAWWRMRWRERVQSWGVVDHQWIHTVSKVFVLQWLAQPAWIVQIALTDFIKWSHRTHKRTRTHTRTRKRPRCMDVCVCV